jgi:predicted lipoprotein with Yx(FWY)xxD motif
VKRSSIIGVIIIVVVVLGVGGYALFHKTSPSKAVSSTTSSSSTVASNAVLVTKTSSSLGQYFVEPSGQPLYTFGGDSKGVSNCNGSCISSWPAYQDKGSTAGLPAGVSTIKRTDNGEIQFTYNGMPLYTFVGDSNGQVTGNGVSNFTVAKPTTTTSTSSPNQLTSTPASSSQSTTSTTSNNSSTSSESGW